MAAEDFICPVCDETIRAMGGAESLFETDEASNDVVRSAEMYQRSMDDHIDYLHYCPNQSCPIWRLFPLDWDGVDES